MNRVAVRFFSAIILIQFQVLFIRRTIHRKWVAKWRLIFIFRTRFPAMILSDSFTFLFPSYPSVNEKMRRNFRMDPVGVYICFWINERWNTTQASNWHFPHFFCFNLMSRHMNHWRTMWQHFQKEKSSELYWLGFITFAQTLWNRLKHFEELESDAWKWHLSDGCQRYWFHFECCCSGQVYLLGFSRIEEEKKIHRKLFFHYIEIGEKVLISNRRWHFVKKA